MPEPLQILRSVFGHDKFRGPQEEIVHHVVQGGDALVLMPTGGGKSLCYQIPALCREGLAIVVSPLIALMRDQVETLRQAGVKAAFLNSTLSLPEQREIERAMFTGELDMVYVAPERLSQPRFLDLMERCRLGLFAIDEAHCVSQWGHDFRPDYLQLSILHERFPDVPRIALTATADGPTRKDIVQRLQLEEARQFVSGFDRPNIRYTIVPKRSPLEQLTSFIRSGFAGQSGIVYRMSRAKVEETAAKLCERGFEALPYHAGLDPAIRQRNQDRFLNEEGLVMVATVAFGMGIDKPDVRFVAHLDAPRSLEAYYQETGRAGRDGLPAHAWMAYGFGDVVAMRQMLAANDSDPQRRQIERAKLDALLRYCETTQCRRQILLSYFGEGKGEPCGNCDTCLNPALEWDGSLAAQKALSCIYRTGQRHGMGHLIEVLLGLETEKVCLNGHDKVSTFGIGKDLTSKEWQSVFRQILAQGLMGVDEHGGFHLVEESRPVLKGERKVMLRKDPEAARTRRPKGGTPGMVSAEDEPLWEALRKCRRDLAQRQKVPPYVIFHDSTLLDMVIHRPADLDEMAALDGIGASKLERYGQDFLDVLLSHRK
ncbi:DNA helicase RecQ [Telmatospirillum sp. J64-1]|uniref:DNA helicase RecQ n=1 Tax=Telmatospirillum sp. J64-1 TaxID=2502183 RepID=UPI00115CE5A3|nr:DNA helicase RecQ [Telmatospirillum sp. J64-1]